jgi:hypothetical protein
VFRDAAGGRTVLSLRKCRDCAGAGSTPRRGTVTQGSGGAASPPSLIVGVVMYALDATCMAPSSQRDVMRSASRNIYLHHPNAVHDSDFRFEMGERSARNCDAAATLANGGGTPLVISDRVPRPITTFAPTTVLPGGHAP